MSERHPGAGQGAVVVDIGGEVGALVVHTTPAMAGVEIEVSRVDDPGRRTHVSVLARPLPRGVAHAAVFAALREGRYLLWPKGPGPATPRGPVGVRGGQVTEVSWSALLAAPPEALVDVDGADRVQR